MFRCRPSGRTRGHGHLVRAGWRRHSAAPCEVNDPSGRDVAWGTVGSFRAPRPRTLPLGSCCEVFASTVWDAFRVSGKEEPPTMLHSRWVHRRTDGGRHWSGGRWGGRDHGIQRGKERARRAHRALSLAWSQRSSSQCRCSNFPVAAGTSGHLLGAALAAILVGPCTGVLCLWLPSSWSRRSSSPTAV